jgi:3-hydroxyisobutyrate dehydrogenase-like beta-hydroxyacid dehydrogenase
VKELAVINSNRVRLFAVEFICQQKSANPQSRENGTTALAYLGGDSAAVERARPFLKSIAGAIQHIGPLGTASSLKLAMNLNIAGVAQTLCESLTLCRAAGISDETYFEALSRNSSRSGTSDQKEPKLRQRDYSPQFSLKHMAKDLRLALETAASLYLTLEQTAHLKQIYDHGMKAGWKEDDFIGLIRGLK